MNDILGFPLGESWRECGCRCSLVVKQLLILLLGLLTVSTPLWAQKARVGDSCVAFTGANIIDASNGRVLPDRTVIVVGQRIVRISQTSNAKIPENATVVDASRKYLMPGLWDMHVHTFQGNDMPSGTEIVLPLFIVNGVTGIRDMGSELEWILQTRRRVAEMSLLGPRMVVPGPMLDGPKPQFLASMAIASPEEGRAAVQMLKRRGVDFIKIQSLVPRAAFLAIADECKKQDIPFAGHVPDAVRASEAVTAGMRSFEHLIGMFEGSSNIEDELLKGPKGPGRFLETYDAGKEASLISLIKKHDVWQCPQLFWERGGLLIDVIDVSQDPVVIYVPASWRNVLWPKLSSSLIEGWKNEPLRVRERFVAHQLEVTKRLHAAGVPFLAGTDTTALLPLTPGVSLHWELQRLVDVGFKPLEALQTATINPARFLGMTKELGTIDEGKIADIVLLDANPLEEISNTQKIAGVMTAGRYFSRGELDRMLQAIAAKASSR